MAEVDLPPQEGRLWLGVLVTEFIAILVINAITFIAFARNCHLNKRSTYLIINLTVADLLVAVVTGPLGYQVSEIIGTGEEMYSWQAFILQTVSNIFPIASQANLSLVALEHLHATLYPSVHRAVGKGVYYKIVIGSWLIALLLAAVMTYIVLYEVALSPYVWPSYILLTFLTLTISYVIIANAKSNIPPQHDSGSVVPDQKLSLTLFIVTVVCIFTILPWAIHVSIPIDTWDHLSHLTIARFTFAALFLYNYFNEKRGSPI